MVMIHSKKNIVKRYEKNPVVTGEMMPFSCRGVYNSSAIKHEGKYIMVLRAEGYNLKDSFWLAESDDGYQWKVGDMIPLPDTEEYNFYAGNQYDPRITKVDDTYYVTFCAHGRSVRMGLYISKDMKNFKWQGFITGSGYRNTVLFPEKINNNFAALERPNAEGEIWYAESPDLKFWGNHQLVLSSVPWAWEKIGPCGTPIKTPKGWLSIFHGVQTICRYEYIYHAGVMLTEPDNPAKLIRACDEPILTPELSYELAGHAPNVIFASSQIVEDDGSVKIYYGASDRYQCVADTTVDLLLEAALER